MGARSPGMEFASEMVINAHRAGLDIREVPIKLYPDKRDRPPHLRSFRDGWRHLRLIIAHAPDTMYLLPGLILLVAGIFGLAALSEGPVTIGGQYFGIHFVALSAMATLIGLSAILLGMLAKVAIAIYHPIATGKVVPWLKRGRPLEWLVGARRPADACRASPRTRCWRSNGCSSAAPMEQSVHLVLRDHHGLRGRRDDGLVRLRAEAAARQSRRRGSLGPERLDAPESRFCRSIMPVHDGAEWIGATLDSLAAEPADGLEIIVIDSSPTKPRRRSLSDSPIDCPLHSMRRPDIKPWQTKTNLGVELASADHVCILHQDDLWLPGRLAAVRGWIANFPTAALHLAPSRLIDRHGRAIGKWNCPLPPDEPLGPQFLLERLLVQNFVSVPAPVFRRSRGCQCGGMDEPLWYTADWDIWMKLSAAGPVVYHDEVTTAFRVHGGSLTVTGSRDSRDFRSQMEIVLDRYIERIPPRRPRKASSASPVFR